MFDNARKLRAFSISGKSHLLIQVCIVKDIRCVVLIISLSYFIIVVYAFKLFAKFSIVLNKVYPMVRFGLIPDLSILAAAFSCLMHGIIKILKLITYL